MIHTASETADPDRRLAALVARVASGFQERFGRPPQWLAAGPGRVNLIGEHVDYNDGFVLPMAIERHIIVAADLAQSRPREDQAAPHITRIASADQPDIALAACDRPIEKAEPAWANYVRGVMAGFEARGAKVPCLDLFIDADLPLGSGLSSSAALEVSTATLLEAVLGMPLDPVDKALLCQTAEHTFAGVPCGIMDQFASVMGRRDHLLLLDCRSRQVQWVPLSDPAVAVLIINTNVRHELGSGEYAQRRAQCEEAARALGVPSLRDATMAQLESHRRDMDNVGDIVFRRGRHVITEIQRTLDAAAALREGNWPAVGALMGASHASLRDDFEVSCEELDVLVEIAGGVRAGAAGEQLRSGVIGCRMTGGGFGGCAVALIRREHESALCDHFAREYRARTGIEASLFTTRPADGAQLCRAPRA